MMLDMQTVDFMTNVSRPEISKEDAELLQLFRNRKPIRQEVPVEEEPVEEEPIEEVHFLRDYGWYIPLGLSAISNLAGIAVWMFSGNGTSPLFSVAAVACYIASVFAMPKHD